MAGWSELPFDIIHKVSTYLMTVEDFLAFSAVCHSWQSVHLARKWHPGPQVPMLMCSDAENGSFRSFISLYTNRVYNSEIPEIRGRQCWGSSLGWLITIGYAYEIHLFSPLTRVSRRLPAMSSLQIYCGRSADWFGFIRKAHVFRHPCTSSDGDGNEDELVVMIIYGNFNRLAVCRPGYRTVFVGGGSCSVASSAPGCKSNSVCFVGRRFIEGWPRGMTHVDLMVYCMERGVSEPLSLGLDAPKSYCFPLWLTPTLY